MGTWDGYDDLTPSEYDLTNGWKKMPDLPPTILVPFQYRPEREPTEPRIDLPGGMAREIREELKDGNHVPMRCTIFRRYTPDAVRHAVVSLVKEMEQRTRLPLALAPYDATSPGVIVVDDKDGREPPDVRFRIVPA